ncbi:MAG: Fur family transcriptional regulator [Planctomycetota bacterium]
MEPNTPSCDTTGAMPSDAIRGLLRSRGLRVTQQRERLYAALAASTRHPSADELFCEVRHLQRGLSLATVYNTLEVFAEVGLCRKIPSDGVARYDADVSDHIHIHMADGRVIDVPGALGDRLLSAIRPADLAEIERELGVKIDGLNLDLFAHDPAEG